MKLTKLLIAIFMVPSMGTVSAELTSEPDVDMTGIGIKLNVDMGESKYDLDQLLLEQNVEKIAPATMGGELNIMVAHNNLIVGLDGQIIDTESVNEDETIQIATIAGQVGYAVFNDEEQTIGIIATIGYGRNSKFRAVSDEESELIEGKDDMIIGGKAVATSLLSVELLQK